MGAGRALPGAGGPVLHPQEASAPMLAASFADGSHELWGKEAPLSDLRDALPLVGTDDSGLLGPEKRS